MRRDFKIYNILYLSLIYLTFRGVLFYVLYPDSSCLSIFLVLLFFNALLNVHKASADVRVVHGGDKGRKMGISNLLNWDLILIYVRERWRDKFFCNDMLVQHDQWCLYKLGFILKKKLYDDRLRVKKKANKCLWHHSKILFQTLRPFSDWFGGGFRFFYEVYIKNMYFSLWRCCLCFKRVVPFKKSYYTFKPNTLKPRTWCLNRTFPDYLSNSWGKQE